MKINTLWATALVMGLLATASCKKNDSDNQVSVPAEQSQQTTDNNDVKAENDQVTSDATDALQNFPVINGRVDATQLTKPICGCSIDSSQLQNKQLTLNFDGTTPCSSNPRRTRGGKIILKLVYGRTWSDSAAILQITLQNYKITRLSDNKYVVLNGVKTITNVRGTRGRWLAILAGQDSIVYKERGNNLTANLNGTGNHTYSLARRTIFKLVTIQGATQTRFKAAGDTTLNQLTNVDTWGTNRNNKSYTSRFVQPWISDTYCGLAQPNSGQYTYASDSNSVSVTAGVNEQGNPDTRDCAYGYKVSWQLRGNISGQTVVSY